MVLKSGTVDNSSRVTGGEFGRKNVRNSGKIPGIRPIPDHRRLIFRQWQLQANPDQSPVRVFSYLPAYVSGRIMGVRNNSPIGQTGRHGRGLGTVASLQSWHGDLKGGMISDEMAVEAPPLYVHQQGVLGLGQ